MEDQINILMVEDLPTDAELNRREVSRVLPQSEFLVVETQEAFLEALISFKPDIILSDYKLPHFDGMSALMLAKKHVPDTPVIIVTGSMNEDTAVDCMKAGAWDYIIKEHVKRLGPAVLSSMSQKNISLERKQAAEEKDRLMTAINQVAETIVITDIDGTIEYVNPAFEIITGYTRKEAIGQNPSILRSDKQDDEFYKDMWKTILSGETWSGQFINKKKNGTLYTEEATISPVKDATGNVINFVAIKSDITDSLGLEDKLRQSQKMESVGRLAGGVAHDFNNMLMCIMNYTEMCRDEIESDNPVQEWLSQIISATERSTKLTQQLLAFARKQIIVPKVIDINDTIASMLKLLRRIIGEDIVITWRPGADIWPIKVDPTQIDQILANLTVNASDAIGGVGELTIATANASFNEYYCSKNAGAIPGDYTMLTVSDSGSGMDTDTISNIFDPFFTTKEVGKGTGLGLATVYGIVKQNNGYISVYSEVGIGTTFNIYLPRSFDAESVDLSDQHQKILPGGKETILLVEDDKSILITANMILENLGYTVLDANGPEKALSIAAEYDGDIDLLITDVIMPGMNGRDLAESLSKIRPEVEHLFISGFTSDIIAQRGILANNTNFLPKPFGRKKLARKVREILDS